MRAPGSVLIRVHVSAVQVLLLLLLIFLYIYCRLQISEDVNILLGGDNKQKHAEKVKYLGASDRVMNIKEHQHEDLVSIPSTSK